MARYSSAHWVNWQYIWWLALVLKRKNKCWLSGHKWGDLSKISTSKDSLLAKKSLFTLCHTKWYFLHVILCSQSMNPLRTYRFPTARYSWPKVQENGFEKMHQLRIRNMMFLLRNSVCHVQLAFRIYIHVKIMIPNVPWRSFWLNSSLSNKWDNHVGKPSPNVGGHMRMYHWNYPSINLPRSSKHRSAIEISRKYLPRGSINIEPAPVQILTLCRRALTNILA